MTNIENKLKDDIHYLCSQSVNNLVAGLYACVMETQYELFIYKT